MRQFILASNAAYATAAPTSGASLAKGAVGFFYLNNGVLTSADTAVESINVYQLLCGANAVNVQPYNIPIHRNGFSFVKGEYKAAVPFEASVTIPTIPTVNGFSLPGDYTVVITKKGKKFNERNNWTATVHIGQASMLDNGDVAEGIAKWVNDNPSCGLKAEASSSVVTFIPLVDSEDFAITAGDDLFSLNPTIEVTNAEPAYGDAAYVTDLANKAAADHGVEYTFRDAYMELYPDYELNPLKNPNAEDTGFTIFTLRFAEPRAVKTRDEVVNQIVQVAFPTGAAGIAKFEQFCNSLAGVSYVSGAADTSADTEDNE